MARHQRRSSNKDNNNNLGPFACIQTVALPVQCKDWLEGTEEEKSLVGRPPTMDHQQLQEQPGEEIRRERSGRSAVEEPSMRPPNATNNPRRTSTEMEGQPRSPGQQNLATTDDMNEDSFNFPTAPSHSWESQSDSDDRGGGSANRSSSRRDRKFDMTTPTLIDEDEGCLEEEEEMVSLQRARLLQEQEGDQGFFRGDESSLRRTPGASMYKSSFQEEQMRRTPGAGDMHRSAIPPTSMPQEQVAVDDSAVLGFGLTLSTPVATTKPPPGIRTEQQGAEPWEARSVSSLTPPRTNQTAAETDRMAQTQQQQQQNRPPRVPGEGSQHQPQEQQQQSQTGGFTFTPSWNFPKAPQFDNRRPFSPNTLRLTEDLGNLLLEEEDSADQSSQQIFRGFGPQKAPESGSNVGDANRETSAESWTAPYVFKAENTGDVPSRVPRTSAGRGRRGRYEGGRRTRGYDRSSRVTDEQRQQLPSFLPYAQQPVPVRSMQATSFGNNPFMSGGGDSSAAATTYAPSDQQAHQPSPRFFNFGGAFAPPAKDSSVNFKPPGAAPPAAHDTDQGSRGAFLTFPQPQYQQQAIEQGQGQHQDMPPPTFGQNTAFPSGGYQIHSFQPLPPMAGPSRESPFYPTPNPSFGASGISSPTFGFTAVSPPPQSFVSTASPYPQPHSATSATSPYPQHPAAPSPYLHQQQQLSGATSPYPLKPQPQPQQTGATSPYTRQQQQPRGQVASPYHQQRPQSRTAASPQQQQHTQEQSASSYPPHRLGMQATAHEFVPMASAPPPTQQRASSAPQFHPPPPQQQWTGAVPVQFGGQMVGWPSSSPGWIASGGYIYVMPQAPPSQPTESARAGVTPSPSHISPWPDHGMSPSPNIFITAPPTHIEGPHHPVPVAAPTPMLAGGPAQGPREQQQAAQHRQKGKKGQARRGSKQGKPDKGKRPDSSASNAPPTQQQRKATPVNTAVGGGAKSKKKQSTKGRDSQTSELTAAGTASARSTPSNVPTPANVPPGDDGHMSASEDPVGSKRSELIESPATRSAFKDFYRKFRSEERSSFQGAEDYAIQSLEDGSLPGKVHWRVYLELADLAKRSNRFADARRLYQQVCQLQPYASQGWLEYSKLEEECGHLNRGARILHAGLQYCEYSENLLTRAIKHEEKLGNLSRARELLARLKHVGIEKVWRTVLEGALLEARAGNVIMARRVLKYLMHHVPWYGPLYLEAYRLERDLGRTVEALEVVERGLAAIPRYGPLWFGAFRLCEEMDRSENDFDLTRTMLMIDRATDNISKELIWKVHLDAAQMLERAAVDLRASTDETGEALEEDFDHILSNCRRRFALTIINCPPNLRWKVWLASGRMEVSVGNVERARSLFLRAHKVVPEKGRATTLLECARLEEFAGDRELASAILCKSRVEYGSDWKVWLESVLLEMRADNQARATELAKGALGIHPGTGRLWASLVQLRYYEGGEEAQFSTLKKALNAVPKSGEVWCEAGRIHLNPCSKTFNLDRARRHLFFATRFTPQYGDSFLETLRLEFLEQWVSPIASLVWESTKGRIIECDKSDFNSQLADYINKIFFELLTICDSEGTSAKRSEEDMGLTTKGIIDDDTASHIRQHLEPSYRESSVDLSELELRCANADPNYGLLWFHCRFSPTDTARRILSRATEKVVTELRSFVHLYITAMIRSSAIMATIAAGKEAEVDDFEEEYPPLDDEGSWEDFIDKRLLAAPAFATILHMKKQGGKGVVFLENTITASMFATGLAELNKHQPIGGLSWNERRKELFGTDALFS